MSCVTIDSGEVVCGYRISCCTTSMSCVTIDSGEVVCVWLPDIVLYNKYVLCNNRQW